VTATPSDIFGDYARISFGTAGYTKTVFVDDREYHHYKGSVHGGANAIRAIATYNGWNK